MSASGDQSTEVTRRLGEAGAIFEKLARIWRHANLTHRRKQEIFESCVVSHLVYGLDSLCLRQAERKRIDAFQAKCLRRVHSIPYSYISRISNEDVRALARFMPLSHIVFDRQLLLYHRLCQLPSISLSRQVVLGAGGYCPLSFAHRRRRGRPRLQWSSCVYAHALAAAGSEDALRHVLGTADRLEWLKVVKSYCLADV